MSKEQQRKQQAYYEGYHDGRKGRGYRWDRHPYLGRYHRGYKEGKEERQTPKIISYTDL